MKQILFVCIGNACRSPMAEGLANHYGDDVLIASSAGLSPIEIIPQETVDIMSEINIDVSRHIPRRYDPAMASGSDLVVNMSGFKLPGFAPAEVAEWQIEDPYRRGSDVYLRVREELEQRVMQLILKLRRLQKT